LTSRRPFLITFITKSYLRSETYAAYKFDILYSQSLTGEFLFVFGKRHARLDPLFFISSHGVGILFTYKVSDVIFGQKRFALRITLQC